MGCESRGKSYLVHARARLLARALSHLYDPSNARAKNSYTMYINGSERAGTYLKIEGNLR